MQIEGAQMNQPVRNFLIFITFYLSFLGSLSHADLVTDATSLWTPITYAAPSQFDFLDDQQTGNSRSSADLVGTAANPALYTQFNDGGTSDILTDGTLFFRARLGAPGKANSFDRNLFIGIDGSGDGVIDIYLGVHNQGSFDELAIYGTGTDLNISPNTTSITGPLSTYVENDLSYHYAPVDTAITDIDTDGNTDYFLSFAFDFSEIVDAIATESGLSISESTPLSYVLATATQDNSFNQDINGLPKTFDASQTWSSLGVLSDPLPANGVLAVPEPGAFGLLFIAGLCSLCRRHRAQMIVI